MNSKSARYVSGLSLAGIPLDSNGLPDVGELVASGWSITDALSVWSLANRARSEAMPSASPTIQ